MVWGSVSDWVAAIGNLGLAIAGIFVALQSKRALQIWRAEAIAKRRAELAGQALISIYKARDVLNFVRSPATFPTEEAPHPNQESDGQSNIWQNGFSIPIERLQREKDLFAKLQSLRCSFAAVLGPNSTQPFDSIREIQTSVLNAASMLAEIAAYGEPTGKSNGETTKLRDTLGWGLRKRPDTVDEQIDSAVEAMEAICRPFLTELLCDTG